jgi:hypothetical protein
LQLVLVIVVHTIDDELDVHSYEECITNVVSTWVCPQFDTKLCECDELAKWLLFQLLNRLGVRLVWALSENEKKRSDQFREGRFREE